MKKILLVDNDERYRGEIAALLKSLSCEVVEAADGERAKALIQEHKFDLVISEVHLPNCNGQELLRWTQQNGGVPIVLMTGFSEIQGLSSLQDFNSVDFLAKPFQAEEVEKVIAGILNDSPAAANLDDNFCKISVNDLTGAKNITFGVYHRLDKNKFVKIAHSGEHLETSRISNYRAKGLKDFYLTKPDFAKFVNPNLQFGEGLESAKKVPVLQKEKFLIYTANVLKNQIFVEGTDKDVFESAAGFVRTILRIVEEQSEAFNLLESLNRYSDHLYAHALGVAVYGVMLAREIGWDDSALLYKVSMAGFFHDIGLKMIPKDIAEKTRIEMVFKDRDLYDTHPRLGIELLKFIPGTPEEVIQAILQHHEDGLGQGFPNQLVGSQIAPMARLIGVVDAFFELTVPMRGKKKLTSREALAKIIGKGRAFDPDLVSGLKVLFNYDKEKKETA